MQQHMLSQRNLVYTGITRGKKLVVLVGQRKALAMAVRNSRTENRLLVLLLAGNKEGGLPAPFLASQDSFSRRPKRKP
jgi:exodeoxyribonuclease V alpha subunit